MSTEKDLDLDQVLEKPATFTIHRKNGDVPFHGILSQFEEQQAFHEYVYYKATLVPKLWWLSLTHHNQVFLNKTIPQILQEVMRMAA